MSPLRGLVDLLAPARHLDAAAREAFDEARAIEDAARIRVVMPVTVLLHLVAIGLFWPSGASAEYTWKLELVGLHVAMATLASGATVAATGRGPASIRRNLSEIVTAGYLVGGALVAMLSHRLSFTPMAYVLIVMMTAVAFRTASWLSAVSIGATAAALAASVVTSDLSPLEQQRHLVNLGTSVVLAFLVSRTVYQTAMREILARRDLSRLNEELEEKVGALARARTLEIEQHNRELRQSVRDRSHALAAALERLAVAELGERTLATGVVLEDRFEIREPIGVGGMGVVYAALDRARDLDVAVKIIRTTESVEALKRFLVEARAVAAVDHPAVVQLLHVDVAADGMVYQVLELLGGRSLEAHLQEGPLDDVTALRLGEIVAGALAAAHRQGVVHRDIKPGNLMLSDGPPGVKVLDFGLAKLRQPGAMRTTGGVLLGTAEFMAPEQISSPDEVTGTADVYALGVTLFLCLAGRLPFVADAPMETINRHLHDQPAQLAELAPHVLPALAALVMRCLAKAPAARPTAEQLRAELAAIAAQIDAPPFDALAGRRTRQHTRRMRGARDASPAS